MSRNATLFLIVGVLILSALACGPLGASEEPTAVPPPPTDVPTDVPATTAPSKPTTPPKPESTGITAANAANITELWFQQASSTPLTATAASPVTHEIASFGFDKIVRLWDGDTGDLIDEGQPHAEYGWGLAFSPDGNYLVSGGGFIVREWDLANGNIINDATVNSFVFKTVWAPDGTAVAVVGQNSSRIAVIDPDTGTQTVEIASPDGIILWSVAFSQNQQWLATGNANGTVRVVEIDSGNEILRDTSTAKGSVVDLEFSPDNRLMAACTGGGGAYIWDTGSWDVVLSGDSVHPGGCLDGVFSADSSVYFSVGDDGYLNAFDTDSGDLITYLTAERAIQGIGITGDGELISLALDNGGLSVIGLP